MTTQCLILARCTTEELRDLAARGFDDAAAEIGFRIDQWASDLSSSASRPTRPTAASGPCATVDAGFGRAALSVACRFRPSIADHERVSHEPTSSEWDGFDVRAAD